MNWAGADVGHDHGATASAAHRGRLAIVLAITLSVMIAEVIGAAVSGSLALLADAGHMLTDSAGVALALVASRLASRPASPQRTFGLQRVEVLAALVNGVLLTVVAVTVAIEGVQRLAAPGEVETGIMLVVAGVGLVANLVGIALLRSGQKESLNVRGAYLEVFGDLLGSIAVLVAGAVIALTGFERADAIASLVIAALIVPRAFSLLSDVVHVLLEGTPRGTDLATVRRHIEALPDVVSVHDLHAWTITSGSQAMTAHVVVKGHALTGEESCRLLDSLQDCAADHFDVEHSTFQIEPEGHEGQESSLHP